MPYKYESQLYYTEQAALKEYQFFTENNLKTLGKSYYEKPVTIPRIKHIIPVDFCSKQWNTQGYNKRWKQ
jgi:hypothetical protein